MKRKDVDAMLMATLEDHRLSRGERHALQSVFAECGGDESALSYVRNRAFALAQDALKAADGRAVLAWLQAVVNTVESQRKATAGCGEEVCFSPGPHCLNSLRGLFENCARQVDICVFTITDDNIRNAILAAWERGLAMRIITDDEKIEDPGNDIRQLHRAGIPVAIDTSNERMHHKFAVFDRDWLASGSFNWTRTATRANYENLVVTRSPRLVAAFNDEFERLWQHLPRLPEGPTP